MELGQLRDLLKLLRDSGVTTYKDGNLELQLGAAPVATAAGQEDTRAEEVSKISKELAELPGLYGKMFAAAAEGAAQ